MFSKNVTMNFHEMSRPHPKIRTEQVWYVKWWPLKKKIPSDIPIPIEVWGNSLHHYIFFLDVPPLLNVSSLLHFSVLSFNKIFAGHLLCARHWGCSNIQDWSSWTSRGCRRENRERHTINECTERCRWTPWRETQQGGGTRTAMKGMVKRAMHSRSLRFPVSAPHSLPSSGKQKAEVSRMPPQRSPLSDRVKHSRAGVET